MLLLSSLPGHHALETRLMYPIQQFWRAVRLFPERPAVIAPDRIATFAEIASEVCALAAALQELDPSPDARVGVGAGNSVAHLVALLAVLAAGKTWVPLNPRNGTPELRRIVEFTEASITIVDAPMAERVGDLAPHTIHLQGGGRGSLKRILSDYAGRMPKPTARDLGDPQAIKFTGGTTGTPKGVMQPYRSWNTMIVSQWAAFDFSPDSRLLISAPVTHGSSTYVLPVLGRGGCLVFSESTQSGELLDAIERAGVTMLFMPPILIQRLVAENALRRQQTSSLRLMIYAGSAMSADQIHQAQSAFGKVVATSYGQTEAPQIVTYLSPQEVGLSENAGSVGRPSLLTDVAIADPDGNLVPSGMRGEIKVKGDLVMGGYWRNPQKTAETLVDGWLCTRDAGYMDERGLLFLEGRMDDVIITGGFNVHPNDVEAVLALHPDVAECSVFGIADQKWGEAVQAGVTLRPGATASAEELIAFVKERMGSVSAPKAIHFLEDLPKTSVDKISRVEVRNLIEASQGLRD